jgi:tetratricopeptide (TPR) repeat protein
LGISAAAWAVRRRAPYVLVGWLWYLGMLVPVIGLVQVGSHAMADRYMYLPQIGLMIATAWGCSDLVRSWPQRRWICGTAAAEALEVLIVCSWLQAGYWRDSVSLWSHTLKCTSRNHRAYFNLGAELARLKRYEEAVEQYRESLKILPDDAVAHSNLGFALARLGRWNEVAAEYEAALRIQPRNVQLLSDLGNALARQGRLDEAIDRYRQALEIEPGRTEIRHNLDIVQAARERRP